MIKCQICSCVEEVILLVNGSDMCKYCFAWGVITQKEPLIIATTKLNKR